jgi:hypothetical protein
MISRVRFLVTRKTPVKIKAIAGKILGFQSSPKTKMAKNVPISGCK